MICGSRRTKQKVLWESCPDGQYLGVAFGVNFGVYRIATNADLLHRGLTPLYECRGLSTADITTVTWCPSGKFVFAGSKDTTVRGLHLPRLIRAAQTSDGKDVSAARITLSSNSQPIMAVMVCERTEKVFIFDRHGTLCEWILKTREEMSEAYSEIHRWKFNKRQKLVKGFVECAAFDPQNKYLAFGHEGGVFDIWEVDPVVQQLHSIQVSNTGKTSNVALSPSGDWLSIANLALGELIIWDWKSQTYIIKQQGHLREMNCMAYSRDGTVMATGGLDGKVKAWDSRSGQCFVTFSDHNGPVTGIMFSRPADSRSPALFTSSLDGTCRAFDLTRYRNFRTFVAHRPVQFSSLCTDPSGEVLAASGQDVFDVFVWNVQTAELLDTLSGHEAPVSCMQFSPSTNILATGSWDKSVRLWDIFSRKVDTEALEHSADVAALTFRPDGSELCVSTIDGTLSFWDIHNNLQTAEIKVWRDIKNTERVTDPFGENKNQARRYFSTIDYSSDGTCVICGGFSKWIYIYNIEQKILVKRLLLTQNESLDGVSPNLYRTEAGALTFAAEDADFEERRNARNKPDQSLPGVQHGDFSQRRVIPEILTRSVKFNPTGREFAAVTTEGLLVFSLDSRRMFDPVDLDPSINPKSIYRTLKKGEYSNALVMALKLNEENVLQDIILGIPANSVQVVCSSVPAAYVNRFIGFMASMVETDPRIEEMLLWVRGLLTAHGSFIRNERNTMETNLRALHRSLSTHYSSIAKLCLDNKYALEYITSRPALVSNKRTKVRFSAAE